MSYFHATCGGHIAHARGSSNSLFSTAVISGSSSAPNLRDMIPNTAAVAAALEGCGGVPLIRPLETLHNALSLRQLDMFLDKMSRALLYRTPLSSPPKHPSTPLPQSVQSPNNSVGWSGPPSFVSSSGPSSPNGLSDFFRGGIGTSDSSDFSASIISNDGFKFGAGPCDSMINTFGGDTHMTDSMTAYTHRDSIEVAELYNTQQALESMQFYPIKADGGDNSGDLTPVSLGSEVDPYDFTAAVRPSHIDNLDEFDIPTCEEEDEEMTLTAFTKEQMSRPRLAEIKWIQDDTPIIPQPQKQALGRFECVGAVCDLYQSGGAAFEQPANLDQIDKQYISSKIQDGLFEMNFDAGGEANGNTNKIEERRMSNSSQNGDRRMSSVMSNSSQNEDRRMSNEELQSCFHFGLHHNFDCERGGVSIPSATSSNNQQIPNAPVLTLASSLKDESCISRGFVLPKKDPQNTSNNE
ncbi:inositol hexakisphosphate and diphosphoinositol-pentakisphosphate kinase-like [Nilaparvata lugens]|uniref:inositol hexakisphosphate and diphosphoinositol-pentakisphosphate kinase-like n=1 Tax=Nilaparvata lugens TaxID=108931 RepID=UPI00193E45F4|nr:inositol hexakisphosphate and diphosphoinositol-pentakisphosphate kinase-like [Nilaparvata lugens]